MIYTSKKVDEWIVVDLLTGEKIDIINADSPMCPTNSNPEHLSFENKNPNSRDLLYLFKNEYQLSVFNAESREKLSNLTYVDYSPSIISSIPQNSYDYLHLTSSTNGKVATIDIANGANSFLWTQQFSSPIVAMYKVIENSNFPILNRIPFLTIGGFLNVSDFFHLHSLFRSVYVGELAQSKSVYALSALVEYNQIRRDSDYLIEGPKDNSLDQMNKLHSGYYEYPKLSDITFNLIKKSELISFFSSSSSSSSLSFHGISSEIINPTLNPRVSGKKITDDNYILMNDFQILVFILVNLVIIILIVCYYILYKKNVSSLLQNVDKNITIGKISYHPTDIIGRGCSGTCVYKGLFENRQQVAVKRIIADCFKLANREIELLRKLQHPHLIRYFATEHDEQFLYIAIELAELTLSEYIEKTDFIDYNFNKVEILLQSCLGLAHLHSLDIVHRDIKPQNILISLPISPHKNRKIMITDFGVSKILCSETLTTEFSAGTEGWIAPEVLKAKLNGTNVKASKQNDIFSMGCLIFYTHTNGKHPFGSRINRQSNIINGNLEISEINNENDMSVYSLVQSMIEIDPENRPPIDAIVKHPYFWNLKQSLQFLQDVSDRIECEKMDSEIVQNLEYGGLDVCQGDWRRHISIELQEDLRKFRNYKGTNVRDLLRAIRNKRHHYHELDPKLQNSLGSIPNEFVSYFTKKFPRLIIHSYIALQICKHEDMFHNYYYVKELVERDNQNYKFKQLPRSGIAWFELTKKKHDFVFDKSPKLKKSNIHRKKIENEDDQSESLLSHSKVD